MFKLLPLQLICIVAGILASPEPDGRYKLISSANSRGSIRSSLSNPYQSIVLSAKSQQLSQPLQTNSVTSVEDEDNSSDNNIDDLDNQELNAPASTIATATTTPTTVSTASAPSSEATPTAAAPTTRSLIRLPHSIQLQASSSSSTSIQHHILPPEIIPLPITISTRPGLRTVIAPETITVHEPTFVKVGEVVQKIPTAVSHQSQTVVHKHARIVTPIVAPAMRTFTSQVLRAYHTPLIFAPQTTVVRSSALAGTTSGSGVNAKAIANGGGAASASASASIISNANNNSGETNNNTNNYKKYKY